MIGNLWAAVKNSFSSLPSANQNLNKALEESDHQRIAELVIQGQITAVDPHKLYYYLLEKPNPQDEPPVNVVVQLLSLPCVLDCFKEGASYGYDRLACYIKRKGYLYIVKALLESQAGTDYVFDQEFHLFGLHPYVFVDGNRHGSDAEKALNQERANAEEAILCHLYTLPRFVADLSTLKIQNISKRCVQLSQVELLKQLLTIDAFKAYFKKNAISLIKSHHRDCTVPMLMRLYSLANPLSLLKKLDVLELALEHEHEALIQVLLADKAILENTYEVCEKILKHFIYQNNEKSVRRLLAVPEIADQVVLEVDEILSYAIHHFNNHQDITIFDLLLSLPQVRTALMKNMNKVLSEIRFQAIKGHDYSIHLNRLLALPELKGTITSLFLYYQRADDEGAQCATRVILESEQASEIDVKDLMVCLIKTTDEKTLSLLLDNAKVKNHLQAHASPVLRSVMLKIEKKVTPSDKKLCIERIKKLLSMPEMATARISDSTLFDLMVLRHEEVLALLNVPGFINRLDMTHNAIRDFVTFNMGRYATIEKRIQSAERIFEKLIDLAQVREACADSRMQVLSETISQGNRFAFNLVINLDEVRRSLASGSVDTGALLREAIQYGESNGHAQSVPPEARQGMFHALIAVDGVVQHANNFRDLFLLASNCADRRVTTELVRLRNQFQSRENIAAITTHRESSMRPLTAKQEQMLANIVKHFHGNLDIQASMDSLKRHLVAHYRQHPILLNDQPLPLEFTAGLTQEALQCYYKNDVHTAFRYLFCSPNLWMCPTALHVSRNERREGRSIIFAESIQYIAYIWAALSDETFQLPENCNRQDMQLFFISTLASLGRAHNWEKERVNSKNKTEEYDDLEADRPSCSSGVNSRLGGVVDLIVPKAPAERSLSALIMSTKFRECLIGENKRFKNICTFIDDIDPKQLQAYQSALRNFVAAICDKEALSPEECILIDNFKVSEEALKIFIEECQNYFAKERIVSATAGVKIRFMTEEFDTYEQMIRYIANNIVNVYYFELMNMIEARLQKMETQTQPALLPLLEKERKTEKAKRKAESEEEIEIMDVTKKKPKKANRKSK